ncbi:MAG: competence protein ComFB [Spirochaetaceae bacterium]|nr:MAG: competence protein ComFB [Spirochaetaceae bacterium]
MLLPNHSTYSGRFPGRMAMDLHNLREDEVIRVIRDLCDEETRSPRSGYLTSPDCQLDAACFVLNRIAPRYVSSGRGLAHTLSDSEHDTQGKIDLIALAHEGLKRVTSVRRSYYDAQGASETSHSDFVFMYPAISGRVICGRTFEPASEVQVSLTHDGTLVPMEDSRWPNPYEVTVNTRGTYTFLPRAIEADVDERQNAEFCIKVTGDSYEELKHYFVVSGAKTPVRAVQLGTYAEYHLPDLYVIPR